VYNIAVILAGGIGSRVGGTTPKQLLPLADGRSVLEHSVDAFEQAACIDEIAIVMHPDHLSALQALCEKNAWRKVKKIIPGGAERWESSWHAIQAYEDSSECSVQKSEISLLLHDAARPFVSQTIISNVCQALEEHEAVTVAVASTDTIYITEDHRLVSMPDRSTVLRAQTPQAFHLETIRAAYEKALASRAVAATDDVGIVYRYTPEVPIYIVPGEETNKKITYPEDLQ